MKKFLYESFKELAYNNDNIIIITYDLSDEDDKNEVLSLKDKLWDLLTQAYKDGIKGISDINHLIKNSTLVRAAFYENTPVCVFFYSGRLGGNKAMYCGAIRGNLHDVGKQALDAIINRDTENILEYNWVEASGPVEACFRKHNAYNLPNKYAQEILDSRNIKKIELCDDGFHYKREIGQENEIFKKTIFGINSKDTLDKVAKEVFGGLFEDVEYCYTLLRAAQKLKEEKEKEPNTLSGRPGSIQYALNIVQNFDEAVFYSKMIEMPRQLIKYLEYARDALIASGSQEYQVIKDIEFCNYMLSIIEPLEIISNAKIRIIQYANVV